MTVMFADKLIIVPAGPNRGTMGPGRAHRPASCLLGSRYGCAHGEISPSFGRSRGGRADWEAREGKDLRFLKEQELAVPAAEDYRQPFFQSCSLFLFRESSFPSGNHLHDVAKSRCQS